jgi:CHAT domain-containing protein
MCASRPASPQQGSPPSFAELMNEYNRAWVLLKQRRPDDAISLLKDIIEKDRNFHRAYDALVDAYNQKKDLGSAGQYFRARLERDRTSALAYYGLGVVSDLQKRRELAAEFHTSCLQHSPQAYVCYAGMAATLVIAANQQGSAITVDDLRLRLPVDTDSPYWFLALGEMYLGQAKVPDALQAAQLGLEKARALGQPDLEAAFHEQLRCAYGLTYSAMEKVLDESGQLLKIAEDLNDLESEYEYRQVVGESYGVVGDPEQADRFLQANLDFARRIGSVELEAGSLHALGDVRRLSGRPDDALRYYQDAVRCLERLGNATDVLTELSQVCLLIDRVYKTRGDYPEALKWAEEGRQKAAETGDAVDVAFALRQLEVLHQDVGEYFKALEYGMESVRIFDELHMKPQADAGRGNLAFSYFKLGDYQEALNYYQQSLQGALETSDVSEQESNFANLGTLYIQTDRLPEGVRYLEKALALSAKREDDTFYFKGGALVSLGAAYARLGQYDRAVATLEEGMRVIRKKGSKLEEADGLSQLGDCYLRKGDLDRAEEYFNQSLEIAEPRSLAEVVLEDRRGLAEVERRRGELEQSLRQLESAIATLETMRSRIASPDRREDFLQQNWKVYEDAVDVLAELDRRQPGKGYDREAFAYAERGRARSFQDLLAESKARVTKGLTPQQLQRQDALFADLSKASAALLKEDSEANRQALKRMESLLARWADELHRTNPLYHQLQYPEPYDADRVQAGVAGSGTAILEYSLGEHGSHLWLVTRDRLKMVTLPKRGAIEHAVFAYRDLINRHPKAQADFEAFIWPSERLYEMLVKPVSRYLGKDQALVIVPDGVLWYLPFEALVVQGLPAAGSAGVSPAAAPAEPHYLIQDHSITYAPSASVLGDLRIAMNERSKERDFRQRELLAYGDPVFSRNVAAGLPRHPESRGNHPVPAANVAAGLPRHPESGGIKPQRDPDKAITAGTSLPRDEIVRGVYQHAAGIQFYPLPMTRDEVLGIGQLFRPDRRKLCLGLEATEASLKREKLTDYKRIHFATHSVIDEEVPAMSGVVLSLVNTGDEDGVLRMTEIFNLDLDADLVVLSACQTGLGKLMRGEGMVGLMRSFMYAGSPRVVVSLWQVNDMATPAFMKEFYRRLTQGDTATAALQRAKLAMVRSDIPAYHHPYFWAPFVLVGLQ